MRLGLLLLSIFLSGCSNLDVKMIKSNDGKMLGYLATYEHTRDFGGWHNGAVVYDSKGQFIDHKSAGVGGVLPEVLKAGAIVGGGYFIGRGGDNITSQSNSDASAVIKFPRNPIPVD